MAGVSDPTTIDLVAQNAGGDYLLVMVEDRVWGSDDGQALQLQQKINTYAGYVLDGAFARQYPEAAGQPVAIRLDCLDTPTGHFFHIADHAAAQLAPMGIAFVVNPRPRT